jgi:hypothetical protein
MYPNNALSAGQLAIMAVVVVASLAAWLTLVLLAARPSRGTSTTVNTGPHEEESGGAVTQFPHGEPPDKAAA